MVFIFIDGELVVNKQNEMKMDKKNILFSLLCMCRSKMKIFSSLFCTIFSTFLLSFRF